MGRVTALHARKSPFICPKPLSSFCHVASSTPNPKLTGDDIIESHFWWYFQLVDYAKWVWQGINIEKCCLTVKYISKISHGQLLI